MSDNAILVKDFLITCRTERREAQVLRHIKTQRKSEAQAETPRKQRQAQDTQLQCICCGIFAAARNGDNDRVQKGIWEEGVNSIGGEIRKGCAFLVKAMSDDLLESLLHIFAQQGHLQFVDWLHTHGPLLMLFS